MRTAKSEYQEIQEIKANIDAIKSNVVALTRHLQENGIQKVKDTGEDLQDMTFDAAEAFIAEGQREIEELEGHVKSNPAKSMMFAFGIGVLASVLLGRR